MFAFLVATTLAVPFAPEDIPFVAVTAGADRQVGDLISFTPHFAAKIRTKSGEVEVKDVISLRRDVPLPPFPTRPHIVTATGDRVVGELLGGSASSVRFAPATSLKAADEWAVPLNVVSAIWFTEPPADTLIDPARYSWIEGTRNRDVFRFRNGDTARGTLVGARLADDRVVIQFRPEAGAVQNVAAKELAAVAFNPALVKPRRPKGAYARVIFSDGSRIDVANPSVTDRVLTGETVFGQKVSVRTDAVVGLDVYQGKAVYLSELKPAKVDQSAFLGVTWPWMADRAVNGSPLKLQTDGVESTFDKGLGTRPRTVLTYELGGKYKRFEALVGMSPEQGNRGTARVRILLDGKPHVVTNATGQMLAAGKPVATRLDITGTKVMVLEVDYGPSGSIEADVNWVDARLISTE